MKVVHPLIPYEGTMEEINMAEFEIKVHAADASNEVKNGEKKK